MSTLIQLRRDTESNWAIVNPILAQGEFGIVINTIPKKIKIGDGITAWNALSVWSSGSGGSVGLIPPALMSVNSTDPTNLLLYWNGNSTDIVLANGTVIPTSTYQPLSNNLTNISSLGTPPSNGYVLSSDSNGTMSWVPVSGGGGTVTSVGLTVPSIFTVSGSPITTSGSLSFVWNGASTNFVLGNGTTVATSTYALASSLSSYLTTATASSTYQPLATNLTSISALGNPSSNGYVLSSTTSGVMSWIPVSGGGGTVTSVGLSAPSLFTVTNSPVATTGTLTLA